ncbi:MAG TPA: 50S ribosomal protein L11 methyltransferase [Gemmatimonadaceae bacterium]|nr:50S ribosomal protein L11 methyltransferase [Gemmatimonadaceae bacterium]
MSWLSVRVQPANEREAAIAALFAAGAQGVHEDGSTLVTHFPPEADLERVIDVVRDADPGAEVTVGRAPATDWSEAWKGLLSVQAVGALSIAPPWLAAGLDPARTIVIDPGMAFGTGDHPTTRGVVRLMQRVSVRGRRVADLGAGSAVLSIAAAKLGARSVAAVELDPDAIGNANENVERNGVSDMVQVIEGDAALLLPLLAPVDIVLANIVSSVHRMLLPTMAAALSDGGCAILSGILRDERAAVAQDVESGGWRITDEDVEDIWWSATISRR